jgi:hypothetical protein
VAIGPAVYLLFDLFLRVSVEITNRLPHSIRTVALETVSHPKVGS